MISLYINAAADQKSRLYLLFLSLSNKIQGLELVHFQKFRFFFFSFFRLRPIQKQGRLVLIGRYFMVGFWSFPINFDVQSNPRKRVFVSAIYHRRGILISIAKVLISDIIMPCAAIRSTELHYREALSIVFDSRPTLKTIEDDKADNAAVLSGLGTSYDVLIAKYASCEMSTSYQSSSLANSIDPRHSNGSALERLLSPTVIVLISFGSVVAA